MGVVNYTEHLCDLCKYIEKCQKFASILQALQQLEVHYFEEYGINLTLEYTIDECPIFKAAFPPEKISWYDRNNDDGLDDKWRIDDESED